MLRAGPGDALFGAVGPVRLLSTQPPVFLTGIPLGVPLGIARAFAERYGNVDAGFVVYPTWSIEAPGRAEAIREAYERHRKRFPKHRFRFICNTEVEAALLQGAGLPAMLLNKNFLVSDEIFRPLEGVATEFDAIYVARFVPNKRHELTALVPRVGYVTYVEPGLRQLLRFRRLLAETLRRNPGHVLLNKRRGLKTKYLSREQVNHVLNRGAVGLVLSEEEGSSYASMEYMLAGSPVVSTPSKGGRDLYFDPEFCIVCEPNPEAVRDAVAALRARNLSREYVRQKMLERIGPERERFLAVVDDVIAEAGGTRRYAGRAWPFGKVSGVTWGPYGKHLAGFAEAARAKLAGEIGLDPAAMAKIQLEASELRPIIAAIKERPGCRLLVFGCGNDSPLWERVNSGGTTAFVEDNPKWAETIRGRLTTATVHETRYSAPRALWRDLLDSPADLALELPKAVGDQRWDIVLVDGPAGYDERQPGRMQSIYAASRLVAPGGMVFVHDCERPVEAAFASRFLGDDRLAVEAKGRALLKGYGF